MKEISVIKPHRSKNDNKHSHQMPITKIPNNITQLQRRENITSSKILNAVNVEFYSRAQKKQMFQKNLEFHFRGHLEVTKFTDIKIICK